MNINGDIIVMKTTIHRYPKAARCDSVKMSMILINDEIIDRACDADSE
jgi:hypothetical protein